MRQIILSNTWKTCNAIKVDCDHLNNLYEMDKSPMFAVCHEMDVGGK